MTGIHAFARLKRARGVVARRGARLGAAHEANLDGSTPQTIVTGQAVGGLAVDSSHLYWTDIGGTIHDSNLDGSNPQTIVSGQDEPIAVAVGP